MIFTQFFFLFVLKNLVFITQYHIEDQFLSKLKKRNKSYNEYENTFMKN